MIHKYIFFLTIIFLTSCTAENTIEFTTGYEGDVLVLNAQVLSNHISVNLSHTADISNEVFFDSLWVKNGDIRLYCGEEEIGVFTNLGDGRYELLDIQLQDETEYYLRASAPGFEGVKSNVFSLLPAPEVLSVEAEQIENLVGNPNTDLVLVTLDFEDIEAGDNYYFFRLFGVDNGKVYSNYLTGYSGDLYDVCDIENYIYGESTVVLVADQCFNQAPFTLEVSTEIEDTHFDEETDTMVHVYFDKIIVDFGLIDKSFFDFIRTQEQPEGLAAGLVEPYYNYSSIQGGYGQVFVSNVKSWVVTW